MISADVEVLDRLIEALTGTFLSYVWQGDSTKPPLHLTRRYLIAKNVRMRVILVDDPSLPLIAFWAVCIPELQP